MRVLAGGHWLGPRRAPAAGRMGVDWQALGGRGELEKAGGRVQLASA